MTTDTLRLPRTYDVAVIDTDDDFVAISQHDPTLDYDVSIAFHISQWHHIRDHIDRVFRNRRPQAPE
jgi:hypothetical protein